MKNYRSMIRSVSVLLVAAVFSMMSARTAVAAVEQWGVFEITLVGPESPNPYQNTAISAQFTRGGESFSASGFFDGNESYRIRFMPTLPGEWTYETKSSVPELNGKRGSFTATKPSANNHGPIQIFKTYYLRYADGTPYHQFGTTCYAWVHQTLMRARQEAIVDKKILLDG